MKGRKWMDGGVPILSFDTLNESLRLYGGVWDTRIGRFMNRAWVYSQQYRYLLSCLERLCFHYPLRVVEMACRPDVDARPATPLDDNVVWCAVCSTACPSSGKDSLVVCDQFKEKEGAR